jgi:hypothetical protein
MYIYVFVDSPALLSMHAEFLNWVEKANIEVISFAETKPTHLSSLHLHLNFVPTESASEYISVMNVCILTSTYLYLIFIPLGSILLRMYYKYITQVY